MSKFLLTVLIILSFVSSQAQFTDMHCGSEELRQQFMDKDPAFRKAQEELEAFTSHYIQQLASGKKVRGTIYRIPIVVHVIHNGESIGSGPNISVAQINSQIAVLNKDYRLLNTDSLKTTHAFYGVTDDCEIEFCLASLDPSGQFTTGIDRFNYSQTSYDYSMLETIIKPNTIWNPDKYLNIWVCKLGGTASSLLGYATPPGTATDNDGVVVGYTYFGSTGSVTPPYNKGRTATHEIGHYLNLRHIWGDANCGNDQVSDTAPAKEANYGCPTFPYNSNSTCGSGPNGEMYMNYMDYTDDACMKMFTTGQKNRMRAALTSGARSGLTSSLGCTWPVGMEEVTSENNLKLFPNPCSSHFYLQDNKPFDQQGSMEVFNAFGQNLSGMVVPVKETTNRYAIDTHALPNGTYYLRFHSHVGTYTKPFTIIQ